MTEATPLLARNKSPLFSYFFVGIKNVNPVTKLTVQEFKIYKFENPVTEARGVSYLKSETTTDIYKMSDEVYNKGKFTHPKIRNQNNELAQYMYNQLPVITISVSQSRNI
jgi:hypothetical protein